jgi:hypothetical protein
MAWRAATAILLGFAVLVAGAGGTAAGEAVRFAAIGDLPYGGGSEHARFAALIRAINAEAPDFTVHVGDIKNGSSLCSDERFYGIAALFERFVQPLVYTPGDNEWTDCHREKAGRFDPQERLARLREIFFAAPFQFGAPGGNRVGQADDPDHGIYGENQRWEQGGVVFATLHVVGSFDNARRQPEEFAPRRAAALAWLDAAFARAGAIEARAVVLFFHADPFHETDRGRNKAFTGFLDALAGIAAAFGGPVLLVHGDSHRFVLDRPLRTVAGMPLANVARLQVWGPGAMRAVIVSVEDRPDGRAQFHFDVLAAPREQKGAGQGSPGAPERRSAAQFGFPSVLP